MADDKPRLTYKAGTGDYGFDGDWDESQKYAVWNKLGVYEDIGTPEEFRVLMIMHKEYMALKDKPLDTVLSNIFGDINKALDKIRIRKEGQDEAN